MRALPVRPGRLVVAAALVAALAAPGAPGAHPAAAQEQEEILAYDVVVEVMDGNRMVVTEEITVRSLGQQIRRGIFRDFPTSFPRFSGLARIEAPFEVIEVERDGRDEPWTLERFGGNWGRGGVRVRIGDANVFLNDGVHEYLLRYETARWLSYDDDGVELYWNVTGNGWDFPIERASARVVLPRPVDPADATLEVWTGPEGSTAADATSRWDPSGDLVVETTARLEAREGLTLRLTVPPGVVAPPTAEERADWFWLDWGRHVEAGAMVLLVVLLYGAMWWVVGRDPPSVPIMVRYEPPPGFSPAALGYLQERGWDSRLLSAGLVSLAVQGALRIEEDDDGWTLRRTDPTPPDLDGDEKRLLADLLGSRSSLELSSSHSATLRSAVTKLRSKLAGRLERHYFELNRKWFAAGLGVSVVALVVLSLRDPYGVPFAAWFLMFWLSLWTIGAGTLFIRCLQAWRAALAGGGPAAWAGAVTISLFSTPFLIAEVVVAGILLVMVPQAMMLAAVALGGVNVLFYHLLERPTLRGRGVLDALEGFARFLGATDADRFDRLMPPDRTPELFEKYLPHAIALGLENRWAESFEDALSPPSEATGSTGSAMGSSGTRLPSGALSWYAGGSAAGFAGVASSLGRSFSSSLSSASSPPPSSGGGSSGGGSSSGGSSGGGGGGGGGGGW